jgi:hypothetical protein
MGIVRLGERRGMRLATAAAGPVWLDELDFRKGGLFVTGRHEMG